MDRVGENVDPPRVATGIAPLDERVGGLERGGSYLVVGTPGPAKMVATMQFLFGGLEAGETVLLVTNAERENLFEVARAWGFDFEPHWRDGTFRLVGFREDFELRAVRSVEPTDVLEELQEIAGDEPVRIGVDPGSLFLVGGVRSRLGASYLRWARTHSATVCTTFSVDASDVDLPSSADWMIQATSGRIVIESRSDDLHAVSIVRTVPVPGDTGGTVSVELRPGEGLVRPDRPLARRARDRAGIDEERLLLISLHAESTGDVETWAQRSFDAEVVRDPVEAVARLQEDVSFGAVLVHGPRTRIRDAVRVCRAIRPLTRAAIVFGTDDAIRSTDRIGLLEAGVDDCLSGGIDVRELDLRLHQAVASGVPATGETDRDGGVDTDLTGGWVTPEGFVSEFERRAEHPTRSFFCVVEAVAEAMAASDLVDTLHGEIRDDDGDLLTRVDDRCLVLLQGAREGRMSGFLERLRAAVAERAGVPADAAMRLEVLSHPSRSDRIRSLLDL